MLKKREEELKAKSEALAVRERMIIEKEAEINALILALERKGIVVGLSAPAPLPPPPVINVQQVPLYVEDDHEA